MNKLTEFFTNRKYTKFQYSLFKTIFSWNWFYLGWWKYLLEKPCGFEQFYCRARGHVGVVWYSYGLEPNMHCKFCGDDLG